MGKSRLVACLIAGSVMLAIGILEVGLVYAIRPKMNQRAIDFFGVFASVMLAAGLLPQYWEILVRKEVVGISIPFITIDLLGGVFSVLSLLFRSKFDIIAGIAYSIIIVMDGLIVIAAIILNPRARKRRRLQAVRESVPTDESPHLVAQSSVGTTVPTTPQIGTITSHDQQGIPESKED
ncbi:hypothetical protein DXG03_009363 [Asterophora parasitica]|uniref:Uncharacterized protein n=1 Tax=Asterophora parasitica TaxID=117018 RepID=A0A9P7GEY4_9AGAR|nr:hypothetical protein DXG03_009363 [Asterophora parasitica]